MLTPLGFKKIKYVQVTKIRFQLNLFIITRWVIVLHLRPHFINPATFHSLHLLAHLMLVFLLSFLFLHFPFAFSYHFTSNPLGDLSFCLNSSFSSSSSLISLDFCLLIFPVFFCFFCLHFLPLTSPILHLYFFREDLGRSGSPFR